MRMTLLATGLMAALVSTAAQAAAPPVATAAASPAPPELAEVSVLHRAEQVHTEAPRSGAQLRIGEVSAVVTAVGPTAWNKVNEMGHVVINFNGSSVAERPGEICTQPVDTDALLACIRSGTLIEIVDL